MTVTLVDHVQNIGEAIMFGVFSCSMLKSRVGYVLTAVLWFVVIDSLFCAVGALPFDLSQMWRIYNIFLEAAAAFALIQLLYLGSFKEKTVVWAYCYLFVFVFEILGRMIIMIAAGETFFSMSVEKVSDLRLIGTVTESVFCIIALLMHKKFSSFQLLPMIGMQILLLFTEWSFFIILYKGHGEFLAQNKLLLTFVFTFPSLIINYLTAWTTVHMVEVQSKEAQLEFAHKLSSYEYQYYEMALENETKIRTLYHEIANQMQLLQKLITEGNEDKAKDVALVLHEKYSPPHLRKLCENRIVNVILSIKQKEAEENGCVLQIHAEGLAENMKISDLDLSMLLTNLIDNAIEGSRESGCEAKEEKVIVMNLDYTEGSLKIDTENSTDKADEVLDDVKLQTTKEEKENHGIGITLIRRIVKKYNGDVKMQIKDKKFAVNISL